MVKLGPLHIVTLHFHITSSHLLRIYHCIYCQLIKQGKRDFRLNGQPALTAINTGNKGGRLSGEHCIAIRLISSTIHVRNNL